MHRAFLCQNYVTLLIILIRITFQARKSLKIKELAICLTLCIQQEQGKGILK